MQINGYQKLVLIFGTVFLLVTLLPAGDASQSVLPPNPIFEVVGILVVMGLFMYAFKDLGKKGKKR